MEFEDARVGAEKEKYGILGKTVKIIKTPLARHTSTIYITLNGRIYFAGRFFRVFDRGQNNCYFDPAVKNTNMPQKKFAAPFSFDRHNTPLLTDSITVQTDTDFPLRYVREYSSVRI